MYRTRETLGGDGVTSNISKRQSNKNVNCPGETGNTLYGRVFNMINRPFAFRQKVKLFSVTQLSTLSLV